MKKIVLSLSLAVALGMVSCGDSEKATAQDTLDALQAMENTEEVVDVNVVSETQPTAQQEVEAAEENLQEAAEEAGDVVQTKAESIKEKSAAKVNEFKEKAGEKINEGAKKLQEGIGNAGAALENALK